MSIRIPVANINNPISRNIVKQMASSGFLPVIALEAFVEGGRTYQAYKRGGFDEARERITEEFSGAVFWLGGVKGLNWLFEKIGQKLNNLPKHVVDIADDIVRRPLNNYLSKEKTLGGNEILKSTISKFKFVKVISSVLIANAFIGFVLPKINQAITRSYHKDKNTGNNPAVPTNQTIQRPKFENFAKKNDDENKDKNIPFKGINYLAIANKFESSRNYQLLSVDVGTAGGRTYSARNNDERVEIGFRDISSIYFYMFNMSNMNKWLNKLEQNGIGTRLDPVSAEFATRYMQNYLEDFGNGKMNVEQFAKDFLGREDELPPSLKAKFKGKDIKITSLHKFKQELARLVPPEQLAEYESLAEKMSKLQPKLKDVSIITEAQARDVLNGGHINNPEFLREFFKNMFGEKFTQEYKFVAQSELDAVKKDLINYVKSIVKRAEKTDTREVTMQLLRKASNSNLRLNALNWGAGFVTSAMFLSTFIPKLQYLITKKRTGSDAFPGTAQYQNEGTKAAA
ncbi:MAG: hypothetical protein NC191_00880 [Muribaculaceae bacterium]|nr:hypothetical protein [Muribaculaceae bacterium]